VTNSDMFTAEGAIRRVCKDCGRTFTLNSQQLAQLARDAAAYPDRPSYLPKRCTPCLAARRRARREAKERGDDGGQ